ncbi:MAG: BldC family transcriptional regulator [Actinomycetia bacterium]|jgi:excisionase family DNA binding protein|nr:BldC family transcriptional regulator [Actinomycetes bacterium]MCH9841418.1 BldC family transcriptional regulator [Actinomycetes bacterium]
MNSLNPRSFGNATPLGSNGAQTTRVSAIPETEHLMTPGEVAALFRVDPKTVTRWAKAGKLTSIRTLGGHRRYRSSEVRLLLEKNGARIGDGI